MNYGKYPREAVEDIVRLRRRLEGANVPPRRTDYNVLVGTWNIRNFGRVYPGWDENSGSPKRNYRALSYIAEIVRRFDVVAIQEVKQDTSGIRTLVDEFLGPNWGLMLSDLSAGAKGNDERLAYLYDRRRVIPSGLAGEIVLPPTKGGVPAEQFDRTPYVVGFRAGDERFALLTVHIRYGNAPADRVGELRSLAAYTATEIRKRAKAADAEETNLIVLGDFNIDRREAGNPLFDAFISEGLTVPKVLRDVPTTYGKQAKHYDQIAWFMGDLTLLFANRAGVVNLNDSVFKELEARQVTDRVSDHFPLWVEFVTDRSNEALARTLGLDPDVPEPFASIPD